MAESVTDELPRATDGFAGNHLLATLSSQARALVEPFGSIVELKTGEVVLNRGDHVETSLFPIGPTLIAMTVELAGGRTVEALLIGRRGAVGGIISCGEAPAFTRAIVLVGGPAYRLPMTALEEAKRRSTFIANLFCRFSDYLLSQVMQSVACSAFHPVEQRAARWLLHAQDRTGDYIALTQQGLAGLLGVQRTTVNSVLQSFERDGLIATGRGSIEVADRAGLLRAACECYCRLEEHFSAVIGSTGEGGA